MPFCCGLPPLVTNANSTVRPMPDPKIPALRNHGGAARRACAGEPRLGLSPLPFDVRELHNSSRTVQRFDPLPEALPETLICVHRRVVNLPALLLALAPGRDPRGRPLIVPDDFSVLNDVVRLAGFLPITDRRPDAWSPGGFLDRPFRWAERRANLLTASTRTQMRCSAKFFRHVKDTGLKLLRHVLDALECESAKLHFGSTE